VVVLAGFFYLLFPAQRDFSDIGDGKIVTNHSLNLQSSGPPSIFSTFLCYREAGGVRFPGKPLI